MYFEKHILNKEVQLPSDAWLNGINLAVEEIGITDPREAAAFLATLVHESAGFSRLVENLNYSAQGLANTWPGRFSTTKKSGGKPNALALSLHRNPRAIANNVYANRMGNGDASSNDGWNFRGHGPIQMTGKSNALWLNSTIGKKYGVDFVKDFAKLMTDPVMGMLASAQYWIDNVRPGIRKWTNANTTDKVYMDVCSDLVNKGIRTEAIGDSIGFNDRFTKYSKLLPVCKEAAKIIKKEENNFIDITDKFKLVK